MNQLDGDLQLSEDEATCTISIVATDGKPLSAQVVLDAVADMLTQYYSMTADDWKLLNTTELH